MDLSTETDIAIIASHITLAEDRIKKLAAETLQPGSDKPIEDLYSLDYIWKLPGDRVFHGGEEPKLRAIDYYMGRRVEALCFGYSAYCAEAEGDHEFESETCVHCGLLDDPEKLPVIADDPQGKPGIKHWWLCRCGKLVGPFFARPGVHAGAFAYCHTEDGSSYFDARNQFPLCDQCLPA